MNQKFVELQGVTSGVHLEIYEHFNVLELHEYLAIVASKSMHCME